MTSLNGSGGTDTYAYDAMGRLSSSGATYRRAAPMTKCKSLVLTVLMCSVGFLCQAAERSTVARVLVPMKREQIGDVRLAGKSCEILDSTSASASPAVVIAMGALLQPGYEEELYGELDAALSALGADTRVEFWGTGAAASLFGGHFPEGWVAAVDSPAPGPIADLPLSSFDEVFEKIARRFVGRGPVRVFWLGAGFDWLDGRASPEHFVSPVEGLFPIMGDSGFTLYPLAIQDRRLKTSLQIAKRYSAISWLYGSALRVVQGPRGATLLQAIRDSGEGTVLTIRIPSMKYTSRGLPPKLEILDTSRRRVLYYRSLITAQSTPPRDASADPGFGGALYRIVPQLRYSKAQTLLACGGRRAIPPASFLRIDGLTPACGQEPCLSRTSAIVTPDYSGAKRLSSRQQDLIYEQLGTTACAGPLQVEPGARILLYSPDGNWLARFHFR